MRHELISAFRSSVSIALTMVIFSAAFCSTTMAGNSTKPDWNGVWVIADSFMDRQDGTSVAAPGRLGSEGRRPMTNIPSLKGEYLERELRRQQLEREGKPTEDRGALCLPQGMPSFWGGPYAFEILQTPQQINVYQEWNEQTRRIYLDGRGHPTPDTLDPSFNGHSVGSWSRGVLTVDTVGVRDDTVLRLGPGTPSGPHSDAMHIIERFSGEGPDLLRVEVVVEDEKALSQPWANVLHLHRKSGMEVAEYVCEENNRNPVNAEGVTQAIIGVK